MNLLLLMSVNPGFSGQKFIPQSIEKIRAARHLLDENGFIDVAIQADGGQYRKRASAGNGRGGCACFRIRFFAQRNMEWRIAPFVEACSEISQNHALRCQ